MAEKLPFEKFKAKVITKKRSKTSKEYGYDPYNRPIQELIKYGIININKPSGPSSHQVSDYVKKILKIKKAGHSGTLDPLVTGCLPIAVDRATRIVQTLLKAGKEYICLMHIHSPVTQSKIHKTFKEFTGKIEQIPPIRSAVKRQKRTREIYYLKILEIEGQDVLFKVGCEAGTYIRKLCHDIGKKLKTGAHMVQLIRTKAGPFNFQDSYSLYELKDAYEFYKKGEEEIRKIILPIEEAVKYFPKVWIVDNAVDAICHGADLAVPGISKLHDSIKKGETIAIMTLKDELICLGIAKMSAKEIQKKEKGIAVKTSKVFMERKTYSKQPTNTS